MRFRGKISQGSGMTENTENTESTSDKYAGSVLQRLSENFLSKLKVDGAMGQNNSASLLQGQVCSARHI